MGFRALTTATPTGRILLALAFCFWLTVACSSAPRSVVPKDAPADLQATAAWESYARAASGTQTVAAGEAAQIAHALLATDSAATATQAAGATQASQFATATQQAAQVTATVQAGITTATAAADQVAATQASLATTGTAIAVATEQYFVMLAQAQAATATAQTAGATATSQAVAAEQDALALARARQLQPLRTFGPWAMGLALFALLIGLGGWGVVTAIRVWDARQRVVATGPFGKPLVLLDGPAGQRTIIDPSRFFAPALQLINGELAMPPFIDEERQNQTTARSQAIELRQAEHSPHPPIPLPPPRQAAGQPRCRTATEQANLPAGWRGGTALPGPHYPAGHQLPPGQPPFPADAPWSLLGREWAGQGLPLGVGARGLLVADPETYPHLLLAGTSGSGKTRYGLRPLISSALASGWQVAILDRSGLDFLPFRDHSNAYLTLLRDPDQAIELLAQLYEVIQRRFLLLRQACVSTWGRLGSLELDDPTPGRILVVVDEFANLADALPGRERQELWRYARMIAAEGRKAGVHLALALQDPTHKSLDLR
ncbi:MAG: hypothetical protein KDE28_06265, partial [Anaerolineales bacterium]|nr:hypothetical protein [Anaerolineales bacterium]